MNNELRSVISSALEKTDFDKLYSDTIGCSAEDRSYDAVMVGYAVYWDYRSKKLVMVYYITTEDPGGRAGFEAHNDVEFLGYLSAETIIGGDPAYQLTPAPENFL